MSLLETATRENIINRINQLTPENQAAWGKMNVGQMLCHVTDQLRLSLGELGQPEKEAGLLGRTLIKFLVLNIIPIPKNVPTSKKVDQVNGDGTPPTDFESDRKTLLVYIEKFVSTSEDFLWTSHFKFGALSQKEWAKLASKHLDHHLKQFGV
jgi:hypothetical protein